MKRKEEQRYLHQSSAMHYIPSQDRNQIEFKTLDSEIEQDNSVRFIEAFVMHLDLKQLQYKVPGLKTEGRPSYEPKVFLKLYLYGYLNGIRSSRKLERESKRNIELQWLLCKLTPNYHSIADFRKDNGKALRNTFKLFVLFLKEAECAVRHVSPAHVELKINMNFQFIFYNISNVILSGFDMPCGTCRRADSLAFPYGRSYDRTISSILFGSVKTPTQSGIFSHFGSAQLLLLYTCMK